MCTHTRASSHRAPSVLWQIYIYVNLIQSWFHTILVNKPSTVTFLTRDNITQWDYRVRLTSDRSLVGGEQTAEVTDLPWDWEPVGCSMLLAASTAQQQQQHISTQHTTCSSNSTYITRNQMRHQSDILINKDRPSIGAKQSTQMTSDWRNW